MSEYVPKWVRRHRAILAECERYPRRWIIPMPQDDDPPVLTAALWAIPETPIDGHAYRRRTLNRRKR